MSYKKLNSVKFPEYTGVSCNMLPIVCGCIETIPKQYTQYNSIIEECLKTSPDLKGKIVYLTIRENFVETGSTQSRPGLHTEAFSLHDKEVSGPGPNWGCGKVRNGETIDGLFIATNDNSLLLVDDYIKKPTLNSELKSYDISQKKSEQVTPNTLYWLTDRTPHEALPVTSSRYRQFFRLVSDKLSHFWIEHNDLNPNVSLPDNIKVLDYSKFKSNKAS